MIFLSTSMYAQLKNASQIAFWQPKQAKDSTASWIKKTDELKAWEKVVVGGMLNTSFQPQSTITIYRIEYETTGIGGEKVLASGAVFFPQTADSMSMIVYEHGTAYHKLDVPSFLRSTGDRLECIFPMLLAAKEFIVIAPDYVGWGTGTGKFAYVEAKTEANCTVDIMRAAKQLLDSLQIKRQDKNYLYGYSQGGHAAMATARKIYTSHNEEFKIGGVIVSSGPYSMVQAMNTAMLDKKTLQNSEAGNNLLLVLAGAQNEKGNIYKARNEVIIPEYEQMYEKYIENLGGEAKKILPNDWTSIIKPAYLQEIKTNPNHPFWQFLKENQVDNWANPYPTYFLYSLKDEEVPYSCTLKAAETQKKLYEQKTHKIANHIHLSHLGMLGSIKIANNMTHRFFAIPSILNARKLFVKLRNQNH
jgi:pimeloyl-ACP methyl ester carboxylesterase